MSHKLRHGALFVAILLAIWLPRAVALDRVVTPDEHIWLARSANFYYALAHAEPGGTFQFLHPGVPVMWVGAAAFFLDYPSYFRDAPGQVHQWFDSALRDVLVEHGRTPLELLIASRIALVSALTAILGAAFLQAIKLLGRGPATLGMLLVAFNPFHIGLSQILHVDAMTANLMLLASLALLNYRFRGRRRGDLLLSGVAAGLAWLTRSPALFLLPYAGLVMGTGIVSLWHNQRRVDLKAWWRFGRPYLGWTGLGLATFILLWPAMWVRPVEILTKMYLVTFRMASEGHELPLFYAGDIVTGDPGALFYPVTYLWRSTPVSLIGLALAAVALALPQARLLQPRTRAPLLMLCLLGVLFTLLIGFGAKKFDRYLLPAYPPLDLVAGAGWFAAASWLRHQRRTMMRLAAPGLVAIAMSIQVATAGLAYPYYLSYYNPLLGGVDAATRTMMVGWGEGLDQVAEYLNARSEPEQVQVLTRVWPTSLSYFLEGDLVFTKFAPDMRTAAAWLSSDYYVLYLTEMQRGMVPREIMRYFVDREPVMVAEVQGFPYAYVYDIQNEPIPAYLTANDPCATDFGETVRFLAYTWGDDPSRPGEETEITVYVQTLAPTEQAMHVRLRLLNKMGRVIAADDAMLHPTSESGTIQELGYGFVIPRGMSPETSRLALTVYDPATGTALQAEDTGTGKSRGRTARLRC